MAREQIGCGATSRAPDRLCAWPKSAAVTRRASDDGCYRRIDRDHAGMLRCCMEWQGRTIGKSMVRPVHPIVCALSGLSFLAVGGHIAVPIKYRDRSSNDGIVSIC